MQRYSANRLYRINPQRPFSLAMSKQIPISPGEVDRAYGVPENSTEAGPRGPSGIFSGMKW